MTTYRRTLCNQIGATLAAAFVAGLATPAFAGAPLTEAEATNLAVDAYLYFYPAVTIDVTRRQLINVVKPVGFAAPPDTFGNVPAFPTADMKAVVAPNFDTLYSTAFVDLAKEPMVLSVPDTGGRFYLMPMLDGWSDVFASPGSRTTGTQAGKFMIIAPGWTGTTPAGLTLIKAPTPGIWIIGRTKTDGPPDYAAVHKIQDGYRLTPLSKLGAAAYQAPAGVVNSAIDMKAPPKETVEHMDARTFFAVAGEVLKTTPPHITDEPIMALLQRAGFVPGQSFDLGKASPTVQKAFADAPARALKLMADATPTLARLTNGWSMNVDTMGVYGNWYLKRAIIAQIGLGANLPQDAIYPNTFVDGTGARLDAASKYVLHFDKGATPPVFGFWSLTLYDDAGFQVPNPINRFAVSSWMPFKTNADGSLDLYIQTANPGTDKEQNWLPAPASGTFRVTMRLYGPMQSALTGGWNPPAIAKQ